MTIKRIDHIAIVVENLDWALGVYRDALGMTVSDVREMPEQDVKMAFLPSGDSEIELLEPLSADSGIGKYLAKRGEGLHHICLEVDDIESTVQALRERGIEVSDPKLGGDQSWQAWIADPDGNRIELHHYTAESKQTPYLA